MSAEKLLVVDDETLSRSLVKKILAHLGYKHLDSAFDGLDAWSQLQQTSYDWVFLDLDMPGLTGTELIEKIHSSAPNTRIVVVTGDKCSDTKQSLINKGVVAVLGKPFSKDEIQAIFH